MTNNNDLYQLMNHITLHTTLLLDPKRLTSPLFKDALLYKDYCILLLGCINAVHDDRFNRQIESGIEPLLMDMMIMLRHHSYLYELDETQYDYMVELNQQLSLEIKEFTIPARLPSSYITNVLLRLIQLEWQSLSGLIIKDDHRLSVHQDFYQIFTNIDTHLAMLLEDGVNEELISYCEVEFDALRQRFLQLDLSVIHQEDANKMIEVITSSDALLMHSQLSHHASNSYKAL